MNPMDPENPAEMSEDLPEGIQSVFEVNPEWEFAPDDWESDLYTLSARFEWDSESPNPDGYEVSRVAYESAAADESEIREVLQAFIEARREAGYEMADLPKTLPEAELASADERPD